MTSLRQRANGKITEAHTEINSTECKKEQNSDNDGFIQILTDLDEEYTKKCAICARPDSSFSHLRHLMKGLEISCHGIPWIFGSLALLLSAYKVRHVELLVNLLAALFIDLIIIGIVKVLFCRQRPAQNQMDMFATVSIDNYSFPSGHSSRASMVAWFFLFQVFTSQWKMAAILVWAVLVTASRVLLGRHHISDVICGFLLGVFEYYLVLKLWIPAQSCMDLMEPYFSHFYL